MSLTKVLILAYDFPPYVSVGGLRPYSWLKNFASCGLFPVVITRQWHNSGDPVADYVAPGQKDEILVEDYEYGTVIRAPYTPHIGHRWLSRSPDSTPRRLFAKFVSFCEEYLQFVFQVGSRLTLYTTAEKYLQENPDIKTIIATAEPFVLFKYADRLHRLFGIKWIADYRDPWTEDKSRRKFGLLQSLDRYLEKKYLRSCSTVVTVNEYFKSLLKGKFSGVEIEVIENGFDEGNFPMELIREEREKGPLRIGFAGTIGDWYPFEEVLEVLSQLQVGSEKPLFQLELFGISQRQIYAALIDEKFSNIHVVFHDKMQNSDLAVHLCRMDCLLLFNMFAHVGTKIYDYLASSRLILFCFDDPYYQAGSWSYNFEFTGQRAQQDLIIKTQSGKILQDEEELKQALEKIIIKIPRARTLSVDVRIMQYSRKALAKRYASLVQKLQSTAG